MYSSFRTYTVPFMPWPPLIGIVLQFLLTPFLIYTLGLEALGIGQSNHGLVALITTVIWMGIGLVLYYTYAKEREAAKIEEATPTVLSHQHPQQAEDQILVPIANPDSVPQLMRTAVAWAKDRGGDILVMSAVTVPQQTPISEGRKFMTNEREVVNRAIEVAEEADVSVSGVVKIGHEVDTAILNTIEEYGSEAVLMGWKGQHATQRRDIVLGSNVDTVVQEASSDVLIEKIGPEAGSADDILVPIAGGPHAELAVDTADAIAHREGGHVDIVNVVDPGASESAREDAQSLLDEAVQRFDATNRDTITTDILEGDDIVDTLISTSEDYDVAVIGATREGLLQQFVFGAIPEEFARRANVTTVMTKRDTGITSRIKRLFG